jgi:glycosyltransferase involved in cell wall biosynthesis
MKILHYINNLGSGGAEKLLTDILPLMKKEGHEVSLVISNSNRNMKRHEEVLKSNGIKIIDLNISFYNPFQIVKLVLLIKKGKYNIVHAHLFPSQYWLAFASFFLDKKIKLIKTEHNASNNRRKYLIFRLIDSSFYKRYDLIISITDTVNANLKKWLLSSIETKVIHNGVNIQEINVAKKTEEINDIPLIGFKNILMVGSFDFSKKNQLYLLEVLKLLPKNYRLFLVGEGPNLKNVKLEAKNIGILDRLFFLGIRNDVYSLIKSVDLNILSSFHEGLSGFTLESLASGKPFLGSNVEGIKDIVPNSSYLFENDDAEKLASKIRSILNDKNLSRRMVNDSKIHVCEYDIKKMANTYLETYKT